MQGGFLTERVFGKMSGGDAKIAPDQLRRAFAPRTPSLLSAHIRVYLRTNFFRPRIFRLFLELAEEFLKPRGISEYRVSKDTEIPASRINEIDLLTSSRQNRWHVESA